MTEKQMRKKLWISSFRRALLFVGVLLIILLVKQDLTDGQKKIVFVLMIAGGILAPIFTYLSTVFLLKHFGEESIEAEKQE